MEAGRCQQSAAPNVEIHLMEQLNKCADHRHANANEGADHGTRKYLRQFVGA